MAETSTIVCESVPVIEAGGSRLRTEAGGDAATGGVGVDGRLPKSDANGLGIREDEDDGVPEVADEVDIGRAPGRGGRGGLGGTGALGGSGRVASVIETFTDGYA